MSSISRTITSSVVHADYTHFTFHAKCEFTLTRMDTVFIFIYTCTVVSRASAHGRSYFNVDLHRTGRLPCVKIEVGGVIALARTCVHAIRCLCAYSVCMYTFHIARTITDGGCDRVWHRKLRRKGDSGQFNR